jgi:histidine ammonia-lyase
LSILDNLEQVLAIELLSAAQAYDLQPRSRGRAPRTDALYSRIRGTISAYADDRPMNHDFARMRDLMEERDHEDTALKRL